MVKNQLQDKCGQEVIQILEQNSLENRESNGKNFPLEVLSKANLSKGAQRNFEKLMQVFQKTQTGPRADFVSEIEIAVSTASLETEFYKLKADELNLKIDNIWQPKWDAKLCLRDTLQRIYDVNVKT